MPVITRMKRPVLTALLVVAMLQFGTPVRADEQLWARSVIDALLDWNVPQARDRLAAWRADEADNPSLPLYAAVIAVAEADYSPEINADRYDEPLFALRRVITQDQLFLKSRPDDFSHRLSLSTAQAIAGRLMMEQGHWLSAYRLGKQARAGMSRVMAAKPDFEDGYLILGMFEYFTGSAPTLLRWLGRLIDFTGDRDKGIEYLERCVVRCPVAAAQAADALLLEIAYLPGESCRYIPLGRQMVARYPGNPRYPIAVRRLVQDCLAAEPAARQPPGGFSLATPPR